MKIIITRIAIQSLILPFLFVLASCGSGSGSGDGSTGNGGSGRIPTPPTYNGKRTAGTLSDANSIRIIYAFLNIMEEVYYSPTLLEPDAPDLDILQYKFETDSSGCGPGTIDINDQRLANGTGRVETTIKNCQDLSISENVNGALEHIIINDTDGSQVTQAKLKYLSIANSFDVREYTSDAIYKDRKIIINSAVLTSRNLKESFMIEQFNGDSSYGSGKIFLGNEGYFDFEYNSSNRELIITDQDNKLRLTYKNGVISTTNQQILADVNLELTRPSDPFSPYTVAVKNSNRLGIFPYFSNNAPKVNSTEKKRVDRAQTMPLTADHIDAEPFFFFDFQWSISSSPENCNIEITKTGHTTASFTSECKGEFTIQVKAQTPKNLVVSNIEIEVLPLPAKFENLETIALANNQRVEYEFQPTNTDDGPFSYSASHLPQGLTISPNGKLSGKPISITSSGVEEFYALIMVDNGRQVEIEQKIIVNYANSEPALISGDVRCNNDFVPWVDLDLDGDLETICKYKGSYVVLSIQDGIQKIDYIEKNPVTDSPLRQVYFSQYDADANFEILLDYGNEIHVIDSSTFLLDAKVPLPDGIQTTGSRSFHASIAEFPGFFISSTIGLNSQLMFYNANQQSYEEYAPNSMLLHLEKAIFSTSDNDRSYLFDTLKNMPPSYNDAFLLDIDNNDRLDLVSVKRDANNSRTMTFDVLELASGKSISLPNLQIPEESLSEGVSDHGLRSNLLMDVDNAPGVEFVTVSRKDFGQTSELFVFSQTQDNKWNKNVYPIPVECRSSKFYFQPTNSNSFKFVYYESGLRGARPNPLCTYKANGSLSYITPSTIGFPYLHSARLFPFTATLSENNNSVVSHFVSNNNGYTQELMKFEFNKNGEILTRNTYEMDLSMTSLYNISILDDEDSSNRLIVRDNLGVSELSLSSFAIEKFIPIKNQSFRSTGPFFVGKNSNLSFLVFGDDSYFYYDYSTEMTTEKMINLGSYLGHSNSQSNETLFYFRGTDTKLNIYKLNGNELVLELALTSDVLRDYDRYNFGTQDTNSDGISELIIAGEPFDGQFTDGTDISIFNTKTLSIVEYKIDSNINFIPNIPNIRKNNILTYNHSSDIKIRPTIGRKAFFKLREFTIPSGHLVWQSRTFLGQIMQDSLNIKTGEDFTRLNSISTEAGLYIFK